MATIGFLGCGKIGRAMVSHIQAKRQDSRQHQVSFIQDPSFNNDLGLDCPVTAELDKHVCRADLVVECATADVLKDHVEFYLAQGNMMVFSVTAFSDQSFADTVDAICKANATRVYIPHGAILGMDGIVDARNILTSVSIETIKSPASLGRTDTERTLVYEGCTRDVCGLYPRNVNVHAAVAMAGLGFDQTRSKIISDPAVSTNSHVISVEGEGIRFQLHVSAFASGGVTGSYTPLSACGSLDRVLENKLTRQFV